LPRASCPGPFGRVPGLAGLALDGHHLAERATAVAPPEGKLLLGEVSTRGFSVVIAERRHFPRTGALVCRLFRPFAALRTASSATHVLEVESWREKREDDTARVRRVVDGLGSFFLPPFRFILPPLAFFLPSPLSWGWTNLIGLHTIPV
jgi:hypothetical protein